MTFALVIKCYILWKEDELGIARYEFTNILESQKWNMLVHFFLFALSAEELLKSRK